ncbi:helix-turn-helix domain-containing protein [Rhodovarius crocodyli]|nr:helix-turn-helix transcriptional regulator [Rhodovarius crocodyli]
MVQKLLAVQCKMARAATGLGVRELARLAEVSTDTIARLERGELLKPATLDAIRTAFEEAGVIFVDENGEGPGVRLKKGGSA